MAASSGVSSGGTTFAWNNVILPRSSGSNAFNVGGGSGGEDPSSPAYLHRSHYDVRHLAAGATYEAQVQAKNKFGWSERSESVKFAAERRRLAGETGHGRGKSTAPHSAN